MVDFKVHGRCAMIACQLTTMVGEWSPVLPEGSNRDLSPFHDDLANGAPGRFPA